MSVINQDASGFYYVITNKAGCWGNQDIDPIEGQYYPYETHMLSNAELIYDILIDKGWSHLAICGVLGNMAAESRMNPAQGQDGKKYLGSYGYGLCQWSPSSTYTDWAKANNHDIYLASYQIEFLDETGEDDWIINPNYNYNLTWSQYISYDGTDYDAEWLAMAFFRNYERGSYLPTYRQSCAAWYSNYFQGYTPSPPPPYDPTPYKRYRVNGMPLWMMLKRKQLFNYERKETEW